MELDALIVVDEYEPKEHLEENLDLLFRARVIPHVVPRSQFHTWYAKEQPNLTKAHLLYLNPSLRHYNPGGALKFHRENDAIPAVFSSNGEHITVHPRDIRILEDGRVIHFNNHFMLDQRTELKLPNVEPPLIIVLCHNRAAYLGLSLNGLSYSLGEYIKDVPITIVLSAPTPDVKVVALEFQEKHPHAQVLEITQNAYLSAINYTLQWYGKQHKSFVIFEDDFILPPTSKHLYPAWPWFFVERLKHFDVINWSPSLENLPLPYKKFQIDGNSFSIVTDKMKREFEPHKRWLNNFECKDLFTCGNSTAVTLDFYRRCARSTVDFCPVDRTFERLAVGRCTPTLFGYHIGWNQEQDGFKSLHAKRWGANPPEVTVIDLKNKKQKTLKLSEFMTVTQ